MGSPNSQEQDRPGVVFQNSKSMLDFVLGRLKVPPGALTPDEWLEIATAVTERCKPFLKYLSGLVSLRDFLCRTFDPDGNMLPGDLSRIISPVQFGQGLGPNTLCKDIWTSFGSKGSKTSLLLSRDGEWIAFEFDGEMGNIFQGARTCIRATKVNSISFLKTDLQKWPHVLGTWNGCQSFISCLWMTCRQTIEEREKYLAGLKLLTENLLAIGNRFG